jgi:hypothetical protein
MKHVIIDNSWAFSDNPFPAYRCELIFGRNKKDFQFLPVKDIIPNEDGILPENKFKIIKTKEKQTILIINQEDLTDRCLAFIGTKGGFRGYCQLLNETNANILKVCNAGNNCESYISVIAVFELGQKVIFQSKGRYGNDVIIYEYINNEIIKTIMDYDEFKSCNVKENEEFEDI